MTRRPLLLSLAALTALLLVALTLSLFSVTWVSPGRAAMVSLNRGTLWVWSGARGDMTGNPGLCAAGWSGLDLSWRPEFDTAAKMWVIPASPPGAAPPMARRITGTSIILPLLYPLTLSLFLTGGVALHPALARARRLARGRCPACGYDTRGSRGPCPECGGPIARIFARLITRFRSPAGAATPWTATTSAAAARSPSAC